MRAILIVDDDALQLKIRAAILQRAGFEVRCATNAPAALATLAASPSAVGLVLTDHLMPGSTGAQFVREMRKSEPHLPVIVITGMPDVDDEYEALGVTLRFKPFAPEELIKLCKSLLETTFARGA